MCSLRLVTVYFTENIEKDPKVNCIGIGTGSLEMRINLDKKCQIL